MRVETPLSGKVEHNRPQFYDVLIVLGGNIRFADGRYKSTDWSIGPEKSRGGHWRIKAAAELVKQHKVGKIIFSTGFTYPDPSAPSEARVMYHEFLNEFPDQRKPENIKIELETGSYSTIKNAEETINLLKGNFYKRDIVIGILTSSYHLPRARLMFATEMIKQKLDKSLALVSAEQILLRSAKDAEERARIKGEITRAYTDDEMQGSENDEGRMGRERRGIRDFIEGKYNPLPPGNLRPELLDPR